MLFKRAFLPALHYLLSFPATDVPLNTVASFGAAGLAPQYGKAERTKASLSAQ